MLAKVIYLDSLETWPPTQDPPRPVRPHVPSVHVHPQSSFARSVRPRSSMVLLRTFGSVRRRPSSPPLAVCLLHYLPRRALSLQKTAGAAATGGSPALASAIAPSEASLDSHPSLCGQCISKIVVSHSEFSCFLQILVAPEKKGSPVFAGFGGFCVMSVLFRSRTPYFSVAIVATV